MKLTQHACYAEQLKRMYYKQLSQVIVMDSWAIPGRLSPPPFRSVISVSSLLSVFCLYHSRIKYYRNETDPTCLLCRAAEENVLHFILQCEQLQSEREALLSGSGY
jgi:hypothetical protein